MVYYTRISSLLMKFLLFKLLPVTFGVLMLDKCNCDYFSPKSGLSFIFSSTNLLWLIVLKIFNSIHTNGDQGSHKWPRWVPRWLGWKVIMQWWVVWSVMFGGWLGICHVSEKNHIFSITFSQFTHFFRKYFWEWSSLEWPHSSGFCEVNQLGSFVSEIPYLFWTLTSLIQAVVECEVHK